MAKKAFRVTIRDIAAAGGIHPSTVSLALRDDPRLPEKTRAKIKGLAKKLGYEANPFVSAWLRHVRQPELAQQGAGMVFILGMEASELVAKESYYRTFIDGARAEAAALGYVVTEIVFGRDSTPSLLKSIARLRYRGVRGAIVFDPAECLSPEVVRELESDFAVVVMLRCGGGHRFHRVGTDIALNTTLALGRLRELGCRRIGFPVKPSGVDRIRTEAACAYLGQQQVWPVKERIPVPSEPVEQSPKLFLQWVKKHRPDALLSVNFAWYKYLEDGGYRMPEDLIFAHLGTDSRLSLSGMIHRGYEVGCSAVFQLAGLLTANRYGVPSFPLNTLVPGVWSDGEKPIALRRETRSEAAHAAGAPLKRGTVPKEKGTPKRSA